MLMKQVIRVPFERNTDSIKELRREFVLEHDTAHVLYQYISIDEVGFNLVKRSCGWGLHKVVAQRFSRNWDVSHWFMLRRHSIITPDGLTAVKGAVPHPV
ncbi:unnamed protein product [Pleuronectes platessa]|uniref:Uncharacterized protein n=1 Tax=Pleuronectes platessa TaxID=8262 RepID=A0A9N7UWR7_PLEPL|nr:unnamed protein product [Pleuronectes platessa]